MVLNSCARWAIFGLLVGAFTMGELAMAADPQTYQLRFQFTAGQTWQFVSQNDAAFVVEYAQAKDTVTHTSMFLRHLTVVGVNPDGTADVELMLDRAYMTAKNAGVNSLYNSEDVEHIPTEFARVHDSIGKPTKARLSPLGKVIPIENVKSAVDQIELLFQLPEQPIAIGATWKERFEVNVPLNDEGKLFRSLKMERRFELQGVENGIATISLVTVCMSPLNDPFQESQLLQRQPNGTLKFDITKGTLVDRQLEIDDKVVGHQGPGSALTVHVIKVDQLIDAERARRIDLSKPIVPVRVAAEPAKELQ